MNREGIKASVFMAMRNNLLTALRDIDAEIDYTLTMRRSNRALARAKELFAERQRLSDELADYGVEVETHPAVLEHFNRQAESQ